MRITIINTWFYNYSSDHLVNSIELVDSSDNSYKLTLNKDHFFKDGDYRSGYYRDQTLLMSQNLLSAREIFSAVYGHPDKVYEKMSGGRQMAGHFLTNTVDENNNWIDQTKQKNHISDISPTASQMSRLVGLGLASKIYRNNKIIDSEKFSKNGNEVVWGTIGNASTSQGIFFEAINACGVDGYL
mgnify:CR=1 FL=1